MLNYFSKSMVVWKHGAANDSLLGIMLNTSRIWRSAFMGNRELALKMTTILRYVIIALIVLTLAAWALPYFKMDMSLSSKATKESCSLWSYIGMPTNFPQMEKYLDVRYVNLAIIKVPVLMLVCGVIGIIGCATKRGIATTLFPLIFGAYGLYGYLTDTFLGLYAYSYSYMIQLVLTALTLVAAVLSFIFCVIEMKTRPDDYYLPTMGF